MSIKWINLVFKNNSIQVADAKIWIWQIAVHERDISLFDSVAEMQVWCLLP